MNARLPAAGLLPKTQLSAFSGDMGINAETHVPHMEQQRTF